MTYYQALAHFQTIVEMSFAREKFVENHIRSQKIYIQDRDKSRQFFECLVIPGTLYCNRVIGHLLVALKRQGMAFWPIFDGFFQERESQYYRSIVGQIPHQKQYRKRQLKSQIQPWFHRLKESS